MDKSFVRSLIKKIFVYNKDTKSEIISKRLFSMSEYINARSIFVYLSTEREVDTKMIIGNSFERGKKVFVPKLYGSTMRAIQIYESTSFKEGVFGAKEPLTDEDCQEEDIDLAIVPMVSFDQNLNRLGHGKGYYDTWLKNKVIFKIGICFEDYKYSKLAVESHDIKMDLIITEKKVYKQNESNSRKI
ncbi:MAG: 5-formyltetrahydrofolate cyclo-ligase [Clostridia bacterium]|jgi:5-formyltetrahydrofolate cyclo-ligase|nr:5-formyltetrahydrofolate cyclo-ligase [Clostridia bacterium]